MSEGTFFEGISQTPLWIRQHEARSPLFYRDAQVMGGFFSASLSQARTLMPTPKHRVCALGPGQAVLAVYCLEYKHSDIGPYNEVAICVAAAMERPSEYQTVEPCVVRPVHSPATAS